MAKAGPKKTNAYGAQFKATAVRLSDLPDVLIQDVAAALDIHRSCCHDGANRHGKGRS